MTPLEEAIARINDPEAFRFPNSDRWEVERHLAHLKARAILALPEIVKMQEALEDIAIYGCGMLNQPIAMNGPEEEWLRRRIREYERRAREAYLALQPLKKEAE
jgi:hypothetical protein